jgi:hypothetical protein
LTVAVSVAVAVPLAGTDTGEVAGVVKATVFAGAV